jgi:fructose-1,6-bisphosphatase
LRWDAATTDFVEGVKGGWGANGRGGRQGIGPGKPYSLRYVGSMVSDVHRTLLYGGVFMYPADTKSKNGKLRLLYEANPMAFICEQAGGMAIANGGTRILDLQPSGIHCRTGIFLGCKRDVEGIKNLYAKHGQGQTGAKRQRTA